MTLKLWADERTDGTQACCSPEAVRGARALAHSLGIPHLTLDLEQAFRREVVGAFVDGYRAGETPNPCVICNGDLRIDAMVALADRIGASSLATGHYARIADDGAGPLLAAAADEAKDQTYMLSGPAPGDARAASLPAGGPDQARGPRAGRRGRPRRRFEAREPGPLLPRGRGQALVPRAPRRPRGPSGRDRRRRRARSLGEHPGHHHFTVGQRRGLGVANGEPLYVLRTDAGREPGHRRPPGGARAGPSVRLRGARLHRDSARADRVKLRYHSRSIPCRVSAAAAGEHAELRARARRARLWRRAGPDRLPARRRPGRRPRRRSPPRLTPR